MLPSFLITFREVIEATVIIATILGIVTQLKWSKAVRTVWYATVSATLISIILIVAASILGLQVQKIYVGTFEQITEGTLMVLSAIFITWAVFFLHTFFSQQKGILLQKVKNTVQSQELNGLFILVFTAVFREGFEIVLFLTSIYLSTNPRDIIMGFLLGAFGGLAVSFLLFKTTQRLPVQYAFRFSSILLILFAGGLIMRGVHEFAEVGLIPELFSFTFAAIPETETFMGDMIKVIFGITHHMDVVQIGVYLLYIFGMGRMIFFGITPSPKKNEE